MRKTCSHLKGRSVRNCQLLMMLLMLACGLNWHVTASYADDEPCGVWEHAGWAVGIVTWTADSNGDPQASISNATEYCSWNDPCEGTTQENQANPVAYTLISDEVVVDGGGYKRQYTWRANSGCNGAPAWAFASQPLPYHWEPSPAFTGGEIDGDDEQEVDAGEELTVSLTEAIDKDTWHVFGNHTGQVNDTITYKWTASGGSFNGPTTNRSAIWEAPDQGGTYTLTCTIDDKAPTPQAPDTGSRDDGEVVRTITVEVIPEATLEFSGLARSCAGGVAVDGAHDFTIIGTLKDKGGNIMANTPLKFSFEGNKAHNYQTGERLDNQTGELYRARYVADTINGQALIANSNGEEMTAVTNAEGKVSIHVLSSDIVSNDIKIKATWTNPQQEEKAVGSETCDFAASKRLRRFGLRHRVEPIDKGWLFDDEQLQTTGEAPNKVYIKFQVDPDVTEDHNYFWAKDSAGATPVEKPTLDYNDDGVLSEDELTFGSVRRPLADDLTPEGQPNWKFVNGHNLRIWIAEVIPQEGTASNDISDYATIVNSSGAPVPYIELTTLIDGAVQFRVQAGTYIDEAKEIIFETEDLTEW